MADERDRTSSTELVTPSSSSPTSSSVDANENQFKANPEEKFRVRLAAEAYDGDSAMKYREYSTDDEEEPVNRKNRRKSNGCCRCDQAATPILVILAVCLLVVVGFILVAILLKIQLDKKTSQCESPDCVTTSGVMLAKMDLTVDPCRDFYQYACAAYTKDVMIPPDRVIWSTFNVMSRRTNAVMRQLLETNGFEYKGINSSAIQKAKRFYASCMNLTTPETMGSEPMLRLIKNIGSWSLTSDPVSGNWSESSWNFEATLAKIHSYGVAPFFVLDVSPDDKNSSVNMIQIDQAGLSLPDFQSYVGNESDMFHGAYVRYFTDIVQLLGAPDSDRAKTASLVERVWQLEKAIARAFLKPHERADVQAMYNLRTVAEIQELFGPKFDFSKYLHLAFGADIPSTEKIIVRVPEYFRHLGIIMSRLPAETLADYMAWLLIQKMVPYMSTAFQLAQLKLKSTVYKVSSIAPRWESCVYRTTDLMGFATGALYIDKYFTEVDKENVESLYRSIVATFRRRLPNTEWMDAVTKERAMDKVNGLMHKIGYPDFLVNPDKLDEFYAKLSIGDVALDNLLNSENFAVSQIKERRGKVPDRNEWLMTPAEVNAYYDPSRNQIVLPAAILQQPFTHRSFPKSLSFGGLGFIIGHELTHGFDNSGRQFDKYGNMVDWWGNDSANEFKKRSQCLIDEYNSFEVYGEHVDGVSTLGENIADNGGIKISLEAYQDWLKSHDGEDKLLPGLNMTSTQQFFLGYAQVWCTYYTRQYAIQSIVTDFHSNAQYRVNGVLRNVPEFSKAFSCPAESPMNPKNKCSLW